MTIVCKDEIQREKGIAYIIERSPGEWDFYIGDGERPHSRFETTGIKTPEGKNLFFLLKNGEIATEVSSYDRLDIFKKAYEEIGKTVEHMASFPQILNKDLFKVIDNTSCIPPDNRYNHVDATIL